MSTVFARLVATLAAVYSLLYLAPGNHPPDSRVIDVGTVAELYAAAESEANRHVTVRIRPGTYVLTRPLRLQQGMHLSGRNRYQDVDRDGVWDQLPGGGWVVRDETTLDARKMTPVRALTHDCNAGGITFENQEPAIVLGSGTRVSGITVRAPGDGAGIGEGINPSVAPTAVVEDSVIEGGRRAVALGNVGCTARRFKSTLTFEQNIVVGSRTGLTLANFVSDRDGIVEGPTIVATIRRNRFEDNETGLSIQGGLQGTDGGIVEVISVENRFEHNAGGGIVIRAGTSQPAAPGASANGNRVRFFSTSDTIQSSGTAAMTIIGSDRLETNGTTGGENDANQVEAHIVNANVVGSSVGILAVGGRYRGADPAAKAGSANVVTLVLRAAGRPPVSIQTADDSPTPAVRINPANRVVIIR